MSTFTFTHTRTLPFSPSAVFDAIQDPARLAQWWGPDGFSNRFTTFEFQAGGRWVFDMIGPDGAVYPNQSTFERIEPDHQVVIRHVVQPLFTLTITLAAVPEGTALTWEQAFDDAGVAQAIRHIVEPANEQNLNRLASACGPASAP